MKRLHNPTAVERHAWSVLDRLYRGEGLGTALRRRPEVATAMRLLDRRCGFVTWADDEQAEPGEGLRRLCWHGRAEFAEPTQDELTAGCALAEEMICAARWELSPETPAEVAMRAVAEVVDPVIAVVYGDRDAT